MWQNRNFPQWHSLLLGSLCITDNSLGEGGVRGTLEDLPLDTKTQEGQSERRYNVAEYSALNSLLTARAQCWPPPGSVLQGFLSTSEARDTVWDSNRVLEILNSRLMGWFEEFPFETWNPVQISMKIWSFINLHGLGLPCHISNPEGLQRGPGTCLPEEALNKNAGTSQREPRPDGSNFQSSVYWMSHQALECKRSFLGQSKQGREKYSSMRRYKPNQRPPP